MSILDEIIKHKTKAVENNRQLKPTKLLEQSIYFETPVISLSQYLKREDKLGVIAEIKRASPSEGIINEYIDVEQLSIGYMQAGASALSVLSDTQFFKGSNNDVKTARQFNYCPILRKDFIVDEYQVIEAKSIGADCILLIAAALPVEQCEALAKLAKKLGLEVLLEVHNAEEIETHVNEFVDIVGVNNRNLHDFTTSIETSLALEESIPKEFVRISESGISTPGSIVILKQNGFDGFLIGGYFMKHAQPEDACAKLIKDVQTLLS
ncbi:MAG: indole-3-glycerol phosphate synthase TrpC [Bacteroidota bacterium]